MSEESEAPDLSNPVVAAAEKIREAHRRGEHPKTLFECNLCVEAARFIGEQQYKARQRALTLQRNHNNGKHVRLVADCTLCNSAEKK